MKRKSAEPKEEKVSKKEQSADFKQEFAESSEAFNRAGVHIADRVRNALERVRASGGTSAHVSSMNTVAKKLEGFLEDIDAIAAKE